MSQKAKNIRNALKGLPPDERANLAIFAAQWSVDAKRPVIDMHTFAHAALVGGLPLDTLETTASYATPAQRRSWASGALLGCIYNIRSAYNRQHEMTIANNRIAELERKCADLQIQARAAWRSVKIDVPFREPRKSGHNWQSEAVD